MKTLTIDECFYQIRNGANIKQGVEEGGYPITRIETIANGRFNRERMGYAGIIDLGKYESYLLEDGDLLMSHINSIQYLGRTVLYKRQGDEKIIHGMNLLGLKADKKLILPEYAKYYFSSSPFRKQISKITKKSVNQASFAVTDLKKVTLERPALFEQECIANTLNKISKVIYKYQQQLQKLDELIKSRFVEMFGMPGTDTFGWGLVTLGSVCSINPKKNQDSRLVSGTKISFVPMPAVTERGAINTNIIKEYDEVKTGFTYFAENDVLFAKITPCMENGKGAVAKGLHNGIGFGSTEFHVLRPISGKTDPHWIYTLTAFSKFRVDAASNMTGSAGQRRVPASFLANYRVSLPPLPLQEQFADFVKQVDKSKLLEWINFAEKHFKLLQARICDGRQFI